MLNAMLVKCGMIATGRVIPVVLASGEGSALTSLTTSMVDGMKDIASQIMTALGLIVPVILLVVGGVVVVKFGINLFKKFGSAT